MFTEENYVGNSPRRISDRPCDDQLKDNRKLLRFQELVFVRLTTDEVSDFPLLTIHTCRKVKEERKALLLQRKRHMHPGCSPGPDPRSGPESVFGSDLDSDLDTDSKPDSGLCSDLHQNSDLSSDPDPDHGLRSVSGHTDSDLYLDLYLHLT